MKINVPNLDQSVSLILHPDDLAAVTEAFPDDLRPVHCFRADDSRVCNAHDTTTEDGVERTHYCLKDKHHRESRHVCACFWVWADEVNPLKELGL